MIGSGPGKLLSPEELLAQLDAEQRVVAQQTSGPLCVLAGAGTGKTRAITYRIAYGVATGAFSPSSVLAVTFTAKAASQMRTRLAQLGIRGVQARTFHAAAARQLRFFWPTAIGGKMPGILEYKSSLVSSVASRLGITTDRVSVRDFAAEIEWAKVNLISPQDYAQKVTESGRLLPADIPVEKMVALLESYEEAKWQQGVIDFEDVLLLTIGMIEERPDIASKIRGQYHSFVVDEYQDVSNLQQRLLECWLGGRKNLCVVGDVAQTIYSFAGAKASYLTNFSRAFPGARTVVLDRDYRSTPQIVQVANKLLAAAPGGHLEGAVTLRSQLSAGPEVIYREAADEEAEAMQVRKRIDELVKEGVPLSQIAILYRTNAQSAVYERIFSDAGISYLVRGGTEFFKREEIRRAIAKFQMMAAATEISPLEIMENAVKTEGWEKKAPQTSGAVRERWDALNALVELVSERQTQGESITSIIAELKERATAQHAPTVEGVTLSTLHAAKGLEWEAVFLVGVNEKSLPISMATTTAEIEEERRLFYVGITRAKRHLQISYSNYQSDRGAKRKRSRFLDALWPVSTISASPRSTGKNRSRQAQLDFEKNASAAEVECFTRLRTWRKEISEELQRPAYTIFTDAKLREIIRREPVSLEELGKIIGSTKLEAWGKKILDLLEG
ncbi:ATP-dependent DNA helicase UvrD2 [Actinomycetaceae bacterium TAE3-ERU4]|nr:ATP-dependent DNA helicase UvrD2 [Actinomycetaceae bacterium TAE3-ERU4]